MKKVKHPNIIRGGQAIPLGNNFYYMQGRKHSNGGIDIGKDLEVEGGEVMQMGGNSIKVYSSIPFLGGKSPAQRVMSGENPNKVFNAQQRYKRANRIKDDGTKYRGGGRKKTAMGTKYLQEIVVTPNNKSAIPGVNIVNAFNKRRDSYGKSRAINFTKHSNSFNIAKYDINEYKSDNVRITQKNVDRIREY